MEIKIGARLAQLRRKKGLTQEQLAQQLGVSAPAVSKWETDSSYPDITLLCPLARALGTNVDTLLRFEEQLTGQDVTQQINAILETARLEGWEAGEKLLGELLRQYPNSDALKFNGALAQDAYRLFFPEAEQEVQRQWTARKTELLADIRASGTGAYWEASTLQLAQIAVSENRLDEAERLLKELPKQPLDPTVAWTQLFLMKGEPEEALSVTQKRLHDLVWQVLSCLSAMLFTGVLPEPQQALEVCRTYQAVNELFGCGGLSECLFMEVLLRAGRWEEAADWLERYADAMLGTITGPRPDLFSPGVPPEERPASSREVRLLLLKALEEDAKYRPLLQYEKGRAAIDKLRASLEARQPGNPIDKGVQLA